jgi:DNA-binding LacI/PurR family transcriptional regulator
MADQAGMLRHDLLVASCPDPAEELQTLNDMIAGQRVGGMVLTDTRINDPRVGLLVKAGMPFVAFGRLAEGVRAPCVDVDGALGVRKAVQYLEGRGHKRIGFIGLPSELTYAQDRRSGYTGRAVEIARGLTEADGRSAAQALLKKYARISAIICCSDTLAFGALQAVQRTGANVAVIGFDDIPMAAHTHPALTTIHQPIYEIGQQLIETLVRHMNGTAVVSRLIEPELVIRESA